MRDAEKTVGTMIDKQKTAFIGSIDSEGFPNIKAMLQPRKRQRILRQCVLHNTGRTVMPVFTFVITASFEE